ncbi:angiopoietin-like protein 8 [Leptodactylus fuscus]|uniref:angiopoietin-like protein 8 n=1 Tax=Leptodactylus fuscus TaxID=238119 RepID=UPI003F4EA692
MHAVIASTLCQKPTPSAMLLLLLLVLPGSLGEELKKPALQEDFNVLVYGTLQLGQALRDTYSSTNDKLERIGGRHEKLGKKIERLETQVSRARQEMGRIGEEVERLQREEHEKRSLSQRTADDLRDTREEYATLQRRAQNLEKGVQAKEQLLPSFLKKRLEKQNLILQVITEETARQKKAMAEQRERLLTVLKQASAMGSS